MCFPSLKRRRGRSSLESRLAERAQNLVIVVDADCIGVVSDDRVQVTGV